MSSLFDKQLVLVAGKGGVGRSAIAAALATGIARRGRRTLLFEANAKDRYGAFFGEPPVGPEFVELRPNLYAINTNPEAALHEYGLMVLRFERVYQLVFKNRLTRYFLRAIPGLDDYSLLGKCWYHAEETRRGRPVWDSVVFDLPASGHALSMLRIPSVILETVPDGPLTRDARKLRSLLVDPHRTAIVLVTLAEEMPANEAREFAHTMESDLCLPVTHLVINQVYPDRFPPRSPAAQVLDALQQTATATGDASAGQLSPDLAALAAHGNLGRSRRELNEYYLRKLATEVSVKRMQMPYLFSPTLGPKQIAHMTELLERGLV